MGSRPPEAGSRRAAAGSRGKRGRAKPGAGKPTRSPSCGFHSTRPESQCYARPTLLLSSRAKPNKRRIVCCEWVSCFSRSPLCGSDARRSNCLQATYFALRVSAPLGRCRPRSRRSPSSSTWTCSRGRRLRSGAPAPPASAAAPRSCARAATSAARRPWTTRWRTPSASLGRRMWGQRSPRPSARRCRRRWAPTRRRSPGCPTRAGRPCCARARTRGAAPPAPSSRRRRRPPARRRTATSATGTRRTWTLRSAPARRCRR